jgi:SPP1 family predicted phage head-tail adaptor
MMAAGALDRRITIEQLTETRDGAGGVVPTWDAVCVIWAQRTPVTAREKFAAQQLAADADTRYRIRDPGFEVSPKTHRVKDGLRVYDIRGVLEVGRREGVDLLALARAE